MLFREGRIGLGVQYIYIYVWREERRKKEKGLVGLVGIVIRISRLLSKCLNHQQQPRHHQIVNLDSIHLPPRSALFPPAS